MDDVWLILELTFILDATEIVFKRPAADSFHDTYHTGRIFRNSSFLKWSTSD